MSLSKPIRPPKPFTFWKVLSNQYPCSDTLEHSTLDGFPTGKEDLDPIKVAGSMNVNQLLEKAKALKFPAAVKVLIGLSNPEDFLQLVARKDCAETKVKHNHVKEQWKPHLKQLTDWNVIATTERWRVHWEGGYFEVFKSLIPPMTRAIFDGRAPSEACLPPPPLNLVDLGEKKRGRTSSSPN